jgi:segregation and condensation protein B
MNDGNTEDLPDDLPGDGSRDGLPGADDEEAPGPPPGEGPEDGPEEGPEDGPEEEDERIPSLAKVIDAEPDLPEEVLISRIESLIFAFPEPITVRRLGRLLGLEGRRVRELVELIVAHYAERGIILSEVSGGFQFQTHPDNAPVVRAALKVKPMRMSRPALETLAIVAYRQPITRADVEDIRRVDCGGTLKFLFEKGLVRVLGRKEEPGRPILYGTSQEFLELFSLKALGDLPSLREFSELWDEHQELVDELTEEQEAGTGTGEPGEPAQPARTAAPVATAPADEGREAEPETGDDDEDRDRDEDRDEDQEPE